MKNSAGASVDNTFLDLQNSSYPTQPHSIMAKYASDYLQLTVSLGDCYTPEQDLKEKHTSLCAMSLVWTVSKLLWGVARSVTFIIDLFSLYVLFSHLRQHDGTPRKLFTSNYVLYTSIQVHIDIYV